MKKIAILGSTGSIGTQTLEIVDRFPEIEVVALAAKENIDLIESQVRRYKPRLVAMGNPDKAQALKERLKDMDVTVIGGMEGLIEVATVAEAQITVTAVVGMIGIRPTLEAIKAGKDIALANKETLVCAGHLIMPLAKEKGVQILPVDSEHSAIFQALRGNTNKAVERLWLTASGGPFFGKKEEELLYVKPADALKHPNWTMGQKITIDSATMVNKGLEVMEAKWLFDIDIDKVEVVVQPKSIIHSMVEYMDGSVIAQLGTPDMKMPIQYALFYPERRELPGERLDFRRIRSIDFRSPDMDTFYGLKLAYIAGRRGGSLPTVYNAANEKAVEMFLRGEVTFLEISLIIEDCLLHHKVIEHPSL